MYPADDLEAGPANLFLRLHLPAGIVVTRMLGPSAPGAVGWTEAGPDVSGDWHGLTYRVQFRLAEKDMAWFWHVDVTNDSSAPVTVDVVHAQDVALAPYGNVRTNEYYVAQYLDLTPIETDNAGTALGIRQNMPGERAPWMVLGCLREAASWATDALQLVGRSGVRGITPSGLLSNTLPSVRLQHEHTLAMLQDRPEQLAPGQSLTTGFFGIYRPDHPAATTAADSPIAELALLLPEATAPSDPAPPNCPFVASLFSSAPALAVLPLDEQILGELAGPGTHQPEYDGEQLLAYFTDDGTHVVTAAKERAVLRPHGHIMRTGLALVPDESSLTSTVWMAGIFHSQLTQGHAGRDPLLSAQRSYLGLRRAGGLRVFLESADVPGGWSLLEVPSAWAQAPDSCRWWYLHESGLLEVTSVVAADSHEVCLRLQVVSGPPVRALVCAHVAFGGDDGADPLPPLLAVDPDGVTVSAPDGSDLALRVPGASFRMAWASGAIGAVGNDQVLFADGVSRDLPWVTLSSGPTRQLDLTLTADVVPADRLARQALGEPPWRQLWSGLTDSLRLQAPPGSPVAAEIERLNTVLPWFTHDALIHYLAPRGLEQFSGGGWGLRDACQGPVALLLALGQTSALRDLIVRILTAQNERGDWPQGFEFLDQTHAAGQYGAHGDIIYWPLLAVGEYLAATGDQSLLDELIPFVGDEGPTPGAPVLEHLRRALTHIAANTVSGSPLPAYGHGDWNDSLQPADPRLAARLCSTWTVTLQVHALRTLAGAVRGVPQSGFTAWADDAEELAARSASALDEVLLRDGLLCGYGLFGEDGNVEHLVHPSDNRTGLHYSVLPMIHAISADLLTPESAQTHLTSIEEHLLGPDGAHLFDRPSRYQGGPMEVFQRAEAATFFGREIGIMYTHAHLRYAEALARHGDAGKLLPALMLANPIGYADRVDTAAPRQSTCYYSSSDAAFNDRYEADEHYERIARGEVALEGGWRVYSSGPGLFLRLVVESLLGIRRRGQVLEIDPVLPSSLDGLSARVPLDGMILNVTYAVGAQGFGPTAVTLDGIPLSTTDLTNPYRRPGVSVDLSQIRAALRDGRGALHVETT